MLTLNVIESTGSSTGVNGSGSIIPPAQIVSPILIFSTPLIANEPIVSDVTEISVGDKWDDLLDEYERYVDKYIVVYKKAMQGDMSAMTEYVELLQQAQKLAEKIENAEDDMSEDQIERYIKITEKMTNALTQ